MHREEYLKNPKLCEYCSIIIYSDTGYPAVFLKRRFCSDLCASEFIKQETKDIHSIGLKCLQCGKLVVRNRHKSKFCSIKCTTRYKNNDLLESWKQGNHIPAEISKNSLIPKLLRDYLFELNNSSCQKCGWCAVNPATGKIPLHIHHVDGKHANNTYNNLEVLCPNCHSLTENFGFRNKGNGRPNRYKK